jgi:rhamnosyltransferase
VTAAATPGALAAVSGPQPALGERSSAAAKPVAPVAAAPIAGRCAVVLVSYHGQSDLRPLLLQLASTVARLIVVDNSERGHRALLLAAGQAGAEFVHGANRGGLAGAYNRALERLDVGNAGIEHVVFLDEDSDASGLGRFLADPRTDELLRNRRTAVVAPAYRDRATGMRARYLRLTRWRLQYLSRSFLGIEPVSFVINSMSVWRRDVLRALGPFDEDLAVDHVDTEYCLRARRAGFGIYVNGSHEFAHSIGARRRFRFLGRDLQAGGHAPARRWLIARNTVWLARRQLLREPAFAFLCLTRIAYEVVGITLAETRKLEKLAAVLRGGLSGLFARRRA